MVEPFAGLAIGLAGSLHCAGMCGPIALALPRTRSQVLREAGDRLVYQFGRVITYTSLGGIVGLGGNAIALAGYSRTSSIISGSLMVVALVAQLLWRKELLSGRFIERMIAPVRDLLRSLLRKHGTLSHLGVGLLNGLLPCGLVTAALLGSLAAGSPGNSALFMLGFGLGTVPLMSAISFGGARLSCKIREKLRYAAPTIGLVVACLLLVRGMSLGIPHLSPAAPTVARPSCCQR